MKIFISYSSADRIHAFELFRILENEKYDAWLDYFDIMPSEKLENELTNNISKADILCIIFSPDSMSSKWVEYEIKAAAKTKNPPRTIGIIVHSCEIPSYVSDIIHLDARAGLSDPGFIARLKRAIDKKEIMEQIHLLDHAKKQELANQCIIESAETILPLRADELYSMANQKIDSILISINPDSFKTQEKVLYELILNLDPLFYSPMHFFFTNYEEGKTWPEDFGFSEPSFREFFMASKPKIDGKFRWFNDSFDFEGRLDGTDFKDMKAEFSFEFNGKEFNKQSLALITKLKFPTIKELLKDRCSFELIAHYPESQNVKKINCFNAEIDIKFQVNMKEEKKWLTIFKSRHAREEELVWSSDFMKNNPNMIFREIIMNGFVPVDKTLQNRKNNIATALLEGKELESQDHSLGGFYASGKGNLYYFRTNYLEASNWFLRGLQLLQNAVFNKFPTYTEASVLFHCCQRLADCVDKERNAKLKAQYLYNLVIVAQELIKKFPKEIDYRRFMAMALFRNAEMNNYLEQLELASQDLIHSIDILTAIYQEVPSSENFKELCNYKTNAIQSFSNATLSKLVPLKQWERDLEVLNKNASKILQNEREIQKDGPIWLKEAKHKNWPVKIFKTSLLRYSIGIPERFQEEPFLSTTQMEVNHLFKGKWPSEFLSVSFMEKATGGNMTFWVDGLNQMTGFPILEISKDTNPTVSEWLYKGAFEAVAKKYGVDEAHCYCGIIDLNDPDKHRARVYILLLRKDKFAWKFILSFETALFPGMESSLIYSQDHIRAGCTFGTLKLE